MSRISLATRAAIVVSVLFIVTCGTLVYRALLVFETQFIALVGQNEEALLRENAHRLSGNLAASQTTLISAASLVDAKLLADPDAAKRFLDGRTFLRSSLPEGLYLLDKNGRVLASVVGGNTDTQRELLPTEHELAVLTISAGQPQLSSAFSSPWRKGHPLLAMSAPIFAKDGNVVGSLLGTLALLDKNYAGAFASRIVGRSGYLYMTTRDRVMLMHPDFERLLVTSAKPGQNIGLDRALDQGFEGSMETVNSRGLWALATFVSVPTHGWVLASNFPMTEAREPFWQSLQELAGGAIAATGLLFVLVLLIVRRLMRPVRLLTERLSDLSKGVPRPIAITVGGELGVMASAFNQMIQALSVSEIARSEKDREVKELNHSLEQRVQERTLALEHANMELQQTLESNVLMRNELVRTEKQAALGRMVAGVAHELNTPIGNALLVVTGLQKMTQDMGDKVRVGTIKRSDLSAYESQTLNAIELAERSLTRAAQLVTNFKQVAVDQSAEHRMTFDLGDTIREALAAAEYLGINREFKQHVDIPSGIVMDSYPDAIGQLVTVFFSNALTHAFSENANAESEIWVSCTVDQKNTVILEFKDNGRGIAAEHIDKVFEPFFTTRMGLGGSGLGLSIAHNIVTGLLGGTLTVSSESGSGATFRACFGCTSPVKGK